MKHSVTEQNRICNGNPELDVDEEDGEKKRIRRVVVGQDNTSQDSIVSGATDSGLCSASQNSDGASPSPVVGLELAGDREESSGSDGTLVKSFDVEMESKRVFGLPVSEVTEAFRTDPKLPDIPVWKSRHLAQETSDGSDFRAFESVAVSEEFAVFESPMVDGPTGNWAATAQPLSAAIDDDDFETVDFQYASVSCAGLDDCEVSITCISSYTNTSNCRACVCRHF